MVNLKPLTKTRNGTVGRGAALLAFAGEPPPGVFATMVVCAENLDRDLIATTVGSRAGGVIATEQELALVTAAVRRSAAAVVVVAGATSPQIVRRLAAAGRRPVLVARTRQPWQVVLAATDALTRGFPVVEAAATVAAARHATSVVLHNVTPGWVSPSALIGGGGVFATGLARRLRRLSRTVARTSPRSNILVCRAGAAARAIVDATVARDADVLVIGMRRPSPRHRSRCADHVVAATPGNVLVVPLGAKCRDGQAAVRA